MKVDEVVRVESRGYRISVGKPEEKRLCGRRVCEWRVISKWIVRNYDLRMYVYVCMYVCICMYVCVCMYVL